MNTGKLGCTLMVFAGLVAGSKKRIAATAIAAPVRRKMPAALKCSKKPNTTPAVFEHTASNKNEFRSGRSPINIGSQRELNPHTIGTRKPQVDTIKYR